jgi:hypothetical protein
MPAAQTRPERPVPIDGSGDSASTAPLVITAQNGCTRPGALGTHRSDHTYRTLNHRLRVRMLTGWVHVTELQTRIAVDRTLIVEAVLAFE